MRCTIPSVVFAFFAFVFGFQPALAQDGPQPAYVPGRILVKFRPDVDLDKVFGLLTAAQARSERVLEGLDVHVLELPLQANEMAFVNAFKALEEVEYAELDHERVPSGLIPNDPSYWSQWGLQNIRASDAWSTTTGSSGLVIAVIDTGVDAAHPDLRANLIPGWNFYNGNSDTTDTASHGTFMAGTAAAVTNNGLGVAGVCWTCKVLPLKVSNSNGTANDSTVAQALLYAKDQGADVAVVGYAVTGSLTVGDAARQFKEAGGVVAVPAGNDGLLITNILNSPHMLTVSGTSTMDGLFPWTNTGPLVDLAAPGATVSTAPGGGYGTSYGTSYSAAYVAGVAALVKAVNQGCGGSGLMGVLTQSADDLGTAGYDNGYGWGRLNAARAVGMAGNCGGGSDTTAPTVTLTAPATGATVSGTYTMTATASDNVGVSRVDFKVDGVLKCSDTTSPYSCSWSTTTSTNGSHSASASAYDAAGNTATDANSVTVSNAGDTTKPTVTLTAPAEGATVSGTYIMTATASDNVGVSRVEFKVDGVLKCSDTTSPYSCSWSTTASTNGSHSASASAYDAAGNTATDPNSVTVSNAGDTTKPTVTLTAPATGATVSGTYTMTASASDNVGVSRVDFKVDGVLKCSDTTAPYSCSWSTTTSTNGSHSASATAYDAAGNNATDANSVTVSNGGDTTAPSVRFSSPVNGAAVSGRVTVSVSATDNVGVVKTELYIDGSLRQTSSSGSLTYLWNTRKSLGPHTLTARSYDAAGRVGTASISVTAVK